MILLPGGPSDPAGIPPASGAAWGGPRRQTSTNQRTPSVLGLAEALCVGQCEFDGGGQLSDDIRVQHEMRKDVGVRPEVGTHVHVPLDGGAAAAASSSGSTEQPAEQRPPEQDVDPGVQDGINGCYSDSSQISFLVIRRLEVVCKHLYLQGKQN